MQYIALAKGLSHRELIPADQDIQKIVKQNPTQDLYVSLYNYRDHHYQAFKQTKSLAGISDVTTNNLVFDFDDKNDLNVARSNALELCSRLVKSGVKSEAINIYFSGSKGFHVLTYTDQEFSRQEFVNVVFGLAADLPSFDTTINDEQRIFRVPLSRHPKTKLYKIPLSLEDLKVMTIEEIKDSAKDNQYEISKPVIQELPEALSILKTQTYKKINQPNVEKEIKGFNLSDIDFTRCPRFMDKARFALAEGFFYGSDTTGKGERNISFMLLAAFYRHIGFDAEMTLAMLEVTADKQSKRTGEDVYPTDRLQREVISTVFSPRWQGGIYSHNEEILEITRSRFELNDDIIDKPAALVKIEDVADRFKNFAKSFDKNRILTGIKPIDDRLVLTTGMLVGFLGSPGSGKTSIGNSIVEHLSAQGESCIFESLDMYDSLLFTRQLQKYVSYDIKKIIEMVKDEKEDIELKEAYAQVIKNYSNVEFNFKSGPTVEEIEQDVIDYKKFTGKQPRLLVVDYLEKVRGPFSDATANSAYVASRLSDIAKNHDLMVLVLLQPQKSAGDPRDELLSMRKIKGASVIEQDCRVILTVSRPGYDPKDPTNDVYATISCVKNNMGGLFQVDLGWNGLNGTISPLSPEQHRDLKKLRDDLEQIKAHQDDF